MPQTQNTKPEHSAVPILETILKGLCRHHKELKVTSEHGSASCTIMIHCAYADGGRVLGKQRVVFNALSLLVAAMGKGQGIPARLELDAPSSGVKDPFSRIPNDPDFDGGEVADLVADVLLLAYPNACQITPIITSQSVTIEVVPTITLPDGIAQALNTVFHAYGASTGHPRVSVECVEVNHASKPT